MDDSGLLMKSHYSALESVSRDNIDPDELAGMFLSSLRSMMLPNYGVPASFRGLPGLGVWTIGKNIGEEE